MRAERHSKYGDFFSGRKGEYIKSLVLQEYSIEYHTHSFYELNIVLKGSGAHYIEGKTCPARVGSVFIIPPNIRHGYQNHGGLDVYHLLIHRDFIQSCIPEFSKTVGFSLLFETEPYLRAQGGENLFLVLSREELKAVETDIEMIDACKTMADREIFLNAVAKKMIAYLCMLVTRRQGVEAVVFQGKKELRSITDCLNYIHQNFEERLSVELLAEKINMSRSTFIRHFTRICGCSPYQYILEYRLKKAREYLEEGERSFTEIAQLCGFYDASHLRKYINK